MLSMLHMMRWRVVKWSIVIGAILALPVTAYAQEAVVSGAVTDATGGVLPAASAPNSSDLSVATCLGDVGAAVLGRQARCLLRGGGYEAI